MRVAVMAMARPVRRRVMRWRIEEVGAEEEAEEVGERSRAEKRRGVKRRRRIRVAGSWGCSWLEHWGKTLSQYIC